MEFISVLDAPTESNGRIQIAKLGSFEHSTFGKFDITTEQVESWRENLAKLPGGHAPIDLDHSSDRGKGTEAAGWITGIDIEDGKPMADVEWTPLGKAALSEKRYRFISPTFTTHKKDEAGSDLGETLIGAGLTNRPHLNMPAISLSADFDSWVERTHTLAAEFVELDAADSRPPMALSPDIVKALDLAEDADEQKVLDAIQTLQDEATKPAETETKTLDELAKDEGKIVLDAADYSQLKDGAAAGIESKKQLDVLTLDTAFEKALTAGKAVAADREFYEELPLAVAVRRLDEAPQIVNVTPIGKNVGTDGLDAPTGVHEQSFQLDQAVKKHMTENDETDYVKALHAVEDLQRSAA
jgi:phage I-like protein